VERRELPGSDPTSNSGPKPVALWALDSRWPAVARWRVPTLWLDVGGHGHPGGRINNVLSVYERPRAVGELVRLWRERRRVTQLERELRDDAQRVVALAIQTQAVLARQS
jgi:hypothetical protein